MKKVTRILFLASMLFGIFGAAAQAQRTCYAHEHHEHQLANNPKYAQNSVRIEQQTARYISESKASRAENQVITIPVVVHVVYNTSAENISNAQIQSQIDVLNEDFRATNSDVNQVPSTFAGRVADFEIEFTVDQIIRKQTSRTSFGTNDEMKFNSSGGSSAVDPTTKLNMWVCDISGSILGYAQFPGGAAATDGVVMDYQYFGTTGTATAPFDGGRTATHEVGHWLNLRHIWGDGNCNADDFVSDTPNAGNPNYGCPSFGTNSCSGGDPDMFMNYMDYVNDDCMHMFTAGQKARARALFASGGAREAFANGSTGGGGGGSTSCVGTSVTLNLTTDNYGSETSWEVRNSSNQVVESGSGYANNTTYSVNLNLPAGDYTFTINDSYGDGICCSFGNGSYSLSSDGTVFASGGSFGSSEVVSFCTEGSGGGSGGGPAPTNYCSSSSNNDFYLWINSFTMGSINNNSGRDGGYGDYTNLSTTVQRGSSYSLSVGVGRQGNYRTAYRVWIDWNRDGDFDDANELVYNRNRTTSTSINGSFTVPSSASVGDTRMRVSMKYNASPTSCETISYGEVEDYTVTISSVSARQTNTETPVVQDATDEDVNYDTIKEDISMTLYPVPARSVLNVRAAEEGGTIRVFDVLGHEVLQVAAQAGETTLNVAGLANGTYIVSFDNGTTRTQARFVKQ